MKYVVTLNGKQYEVEVDKGQATAALLGDAPVAAAAPSTPAPAMAAPAPAPAASTGGEPIVCPMPGTILSVKCAVGQAVKKGDVLFILEAMKMENEIFAPYDGAVSSVCVTQGAAVDTGAVLCTM